MALPVIMLATSPGVQGHDLLLLGALALEEPVDQALAELAVEAVHDLAREVAVHADDDGHGVRGLHLGLVGEVTAPDFNAGDLCDDLHGSLDERVHVSGVDFHVGVS